MATPVGTNTLNAISREHLLPGFTDQVYSSSPLFWRLNRSRRVLSTGARHFEKTHVTKRRNIGGPYSGYDRFDAAPTDTLQSTAWDWKQYYTTLTIDGESLLRYDSPEAKADRLATEFDQARAEMYEMLALDVWANVPGGTATAGYTNNPKGLDGLRGAIDDGTVLATYAGVDRTASGNGWWKAQRDNSTSTLTIQALNSFFMRCKRGAEVPTSYWSNTFMYELLYSKIIQMSPNVEISVSDQITDQSMVDAGFTNIYVNKRPFIIDDFSNGTNSDTAAAPVFFLNENTLQLRVHKDWNFKFEDFQKPIDQDAYLAKIIWKGNLIVENPRLNGVMTALAS